MPADDCTDLLKALADRTRQRIVKALHGADLGVNEHLRVLEEAGIVGMRAHG